MTKRQVFIILTFLLLPVTCQNTYAQSEAPKFEVGAQFSVLRFSDLEVTEPGFGGRFTYNLTDNIAFEAEGNFFPKDPRVRSQSFHDLTLQKGGRKTQGLFGIKFGIRKEKVGIFGKVRPGLLHFSHFERGVAIICVNFDPCTAEKFSTSSQTDYALDLGGVVELYPSRRTVVRFDAGDTIIKPRSTEEVILSVEQFSQVRLMRSTSHNLQFSIGVGFRF